MMQGRAVSAAYEAVKAKGYVSMVDVFLSMGVLRIEKMEAWRRGQFYCLENAIEMNLKEISRAAKAVRKWALEQSLVPSETVYRTWGSGPRRTLRFCRSGKASIEKAYRTHYVSREKPLC